MSTTSQETNELGPANKPLLAREDYRKVKQMNKEQLSAYMTRIYMRGYQKGYQDAHSSDHRH